MPKPSCAGRVIRKSFKLKSLSVVERHSPERNKLLNSKLFKCAAQDLARLKFIFAYAAEGANPVFGKVFKGCAGFDAGIGVAHFGVVNPVADNTFVLLHGD